MNQGTTASWLLAHTTMYCGMDTEHMSYYSAKAHAQQKEEASPNDCTFLVIHQAFAVTYLNCQREKHQKNPFRALHLYVVDVLLDSALY